MQSLLHLQKLHVFPAASTLLQKQCASGYQPHSKTPLPLSYQAPHPLNLQAVQALFLGSPPVYIGFSGTPPLKVRFFSEHPKY